MVRLIEGLSPGAGRRNAGFVISGPVVLVIFREDFD